MEKQFYCFRDKNRTTQKLLLILLDYYESIVNMERRHKAFYIRYGYQTIRNMSFKLRSMILSSILYFMFNVFF